MMETEHHHRRSFWIVCYDIPNDKRRTKISRILEGFGRRAQYSVFECDLEAAKLQRLELLLLQEIDPMEDDIRIYPLNRADLNRAKMMGRAKLQRSASYYDIRKREDPPPDNPDHPF